MSNLIQYIIQDDPEEELKKKQSQTLLSIELSSRQDTDKNYKFNSRHLLENDFSHLQSKPAPTAQSYLSQVLAKNVAKERNKVSSALSPKPIGNDAASYKIAQNTKGNVVNDTNIQSIKKNTDNNFDRVFNRTLGEEGGYEDSPQKIDTATNMGIQQATLMRFKKKHPELAQGFPEQVKNLTHEQGRLIALKDYYEHYRIGEIKSPDLQETMFDSFFNHSPKAPALWVQRAINQNTKRHVDEDGVFGSETINAMNQLSEDEIIKVNNAILKQRLEDHEREKKTNPNPYYEEYTVGLPARFKRFEIK